MMLNGWEYLKLESLCEPDAPITYGVLKPGEYCTDGVPLLQIKDLLTDFGNLNHLHRISTELDYEYRRSKIQTNDILISLVGTIGRIGLVPKALNEANIHRNLGRIRTKNYEFLFQYLNSDIAKNKIGLSSSGSSQSALNLSVLRALKVPVPPIQEQQKIAKILTTWDKAISTTECLIDNSQQQQKALMQQLLTGKQRLLDDSGERFSGEWKLEILSGISKVFIGLVTTMTKYYVDEGVPLIRNSDIKQNSIAKHKMLKLCKMFADENENRKLRKNDVVTVHTGEVGVSAVIDEELDGCIGFATLNTRPMAEKVNSQYLSWHFNSDSFINWCVSMSTGDGRQNLNLKDFVKAEIKLPSLEEQEKIVTVLTNADREIELLQQQLADLQQEKKALMQQLLTGKRRVLVDSEG